MSKLAAIPQRNRQTKEYALKTGETFKTGAVVLLDATPEVVEAGADPASILGIAAYQASGRDILTDKMGVHIATEEATFMMDGDDAPVASDVGKSYGLAKDADGIWHVDGTDTTNTRVFVVSIDTKINRYEVRVLAANRQSAP